MSSSLVFGYEKKKRGGGGEQKLSIKTNQGNIKMGFQFPNCNWNQEFNSQKRKQILSHIKLLRFEAIFLLNLLALSLHF
jgi:hypothetical protein